MSTVPEETLQTLFRSYCEARHEYPLDAYVSEDDRRGHIEYDARSHWDQPDETELPLLELVKEAYRTGQEAALDHPEWRVVHKGDGAACAICWSTNETEVDARSDLAQAVSERTWGDVWIEHRRFGATEWERVPS